MTIDTVMQIVENHTGHKVTPESKLSDLGMDSLDFLDLMVALEIPDAAVPHMNTVQDLAA